MLLSLSVQERPFWSAKLQFIRKLEMESASGSRAVIMKSYFLYSSDLLGVFIKRTLHPFITVMGIKFLRIKTGHFDRKDSEGFGPNSGVRFAVRLQWSSLHKFIIAPNFLVEKFREVEVLNFNKCFLWFPSACLIPIWALRKCAGKLDILLGVCFSPLIVLYLIVWLESLPTNTTLSSKL